MSSSIEGTVVAIRGASSGLGEATARHCQPRGMRTKLLHAAVMSLVWSGFVRSSSFR